MPATFLLVVLRTQSVSQSLPNSYQWSIWSTYTHSVFSECIVESQSQRGESHLFHRHEEVVPLVDSDRPATTVVVDPHTLFSH